MGKKSWWDKTKSSTKRVGSAITTGGHSETVRNREIAARDAKKEADAHQNFVDSLMTDPEAFNAYYGDKAWKAPTPIPEDPSAGLTKLSGAPVDRPVVSSNNPWEGLVQMPGSAPLPTYITEAKPYESVETVREQLINEIFSGIQEDLSRGTNISGGNPYGRSLQDLSIYSPNIKNQLLQQAAAAPESAVDYETLRSSFDPSGIIEDIYGKATTRGREIAGQQVSGAFDPFYAQTALPTTLDDQIINDILGEQRTTAEEQINRARQRGQLTETGYSTALGDIGSQADIAKGYLSGIGEDIIRSGQSDIGDIISGATSRAGQINPNEQFNLDPYQAQISDYISSFGSGLSGKIGATVGGQQFFTPSTAITKGGQAQGLISGGPAPSQVSPLSSALMQRNSRLQNTGVI